jgi:multidrug resistance efflux pump
MPPAGTSVLELHALLLRHPRFDTAAHAVLAELQRRLRCERVSLGWCRGRGGKVRLAALSSGEAAERRSFTRALQAAMREAVEEAATVIYPLPPGAASGPLPAHEALVREAGGVTIASVPIVGAQRLLGVLLLERREGFDAAALQAAQDAALFIGPVLDLMKRLDAPVSGRWLQPRTPMLAAGAEAGNAAAWSAGTTRRRITTGRVAAVVLPLALAVCGALPAPHEVVAPARLEGGRQRIVSSPIDGYVSKVTVRPGAEVKAGELLVQLDDRDPELARQRWLAEVSQHDKQYREALTQDDPAAIAMARARLQQAQVQLAQAERELEHTRVLAPMAGLVLGGDLTQAVGMPVQRGQTLLTVAPVHDLKVVAEVDEQDVVWLAPGQTARVLFASAASAPLPFTLARVSPVALAVDNRNIFEVEGQLSAAAAPAEAAAALRPGQRGVVRITLAERPRAELWWMAAADLWRRWWWRWVG